MGRTAVSISEKIMHLSEEQLAEVDSFVESLRLREHTTLTTASMPLSAGPFETIWSNPEDDIYDTL